MQKRSNTVYSLTYVPEKLADDFPVRASETDIQTDRPITLLHRHNYLELGFCYEGSGIFIVENKIMPFSAGDATVINRTEMHLASSSKGTTSKWIWVMIDPELLLADSGQRDYSLTDSGKLAGPVFNNVIKRREHPVTCGCIRRLIDELHEKKQGYRSLVKGLMWDIMVQLQRLVPDRKEAGERVFESVAAIAPALSYCAQHFREQVTIADLARVCSVSEPHFRRLFKSGTGLSPHAYLNSLRIRTACVLLTTTDKQITDVGLECGFETPSSFNRNFSRITGTTPREWRRKSAISK